MDETANEVVRRSSHAVNWFRLNSDLDLLNSLDSIQEITDSFNWIWYRRPFENEMFENETPSKSVQIARNESEAWLWNSLLSIDRGRWINFPLDNWIADKKTEQLKIASKFGLAIPKWIVTSSKKRATEFAASLKWNCIIKPLSIGYYADAASVSIIYTSMIADNETFDGIENAPVYLQEAVSKEYDVRTIYCNGELLFVKISSPNLDCRRNEMNDCTYEIITPPQNVAASYIECMKYNNLKFCTSDFVVDKQGSWIFLEHNPNGNWLWMDESLHGACLNTFITGLNK